ncbi:MAG: hypothetical protein JRJ87_01595 [Deltaproteobacteria bacterium]|nr:hypothetical protein [Deltaproteobacteria bacterium]
MKKTLTVGLSLLVALSLGLAFINCGSSEATCEGGAECCTEVPCPTGQECQSGTCVVVCEGGVECCDAVPCPTGEKCLGGACTDCCVDTEAGKYFVDITGMVVDISTGAGAEGVGVAAISPMEALTSSDPTLYSATTTGAGGAFALACFDVTSIALGAVVITDDPAWDGVDGTLYPTGTGVVGWLENSEKVCTSGAAAMAVPAAMVAAIGQLSDIDPDADGFVMGMVVDANSDKVAGAVIKIQDQSGNWNEPTSVYYPNATFTDLTTGTETSANGMFILPALNFGGITVINAEKTGMTFSSQQAAPKGGFVFFQMIPPAG